MKTIHFALSIVSCLNVLYMENLKTKQILKSMNFKKNENLNYFYIDSVLNLSI